MKTVYSSVSVFSSLEEENNLLQVFFNIFDTGLFITVSPTSALTLDKTLKLPFGSSIVPWIDIDTGAASGKSPMLLRLDDEIPFYI